MNTQGKTIEPDALQSFLAGRRSTRCFQERELDHEVIQKLIQTSAFIPSGGNRHGHAFTVVTPGETRTRLMEELTRIYARRSRLLNNPLLRVASRPFVDPVKREYLKDREYGPRIRALVAKLASGEDPVFYGAPAAILIHSSVRIPTPKEDCVIAGFALSLAAESMGLGACFVTLGQNAINASRRCKTIVGLTTRDRVHAVVVVGYAGEPRIARHSEPPAKEFRYAGERA